MFIYKKEEMYVILWWGDMNEYRLKDTRTQTK